MNYNKKRVSQGCFALISLYALVSLTPAFASSVSGGAMTININGTDLAAAFTHNFDPSRPSFYLEEYFTASQAASRISNQLLEEHIIPDPMPISGSGLEFTVNTSSTSGQNQETNLSFDPSDLTGTATGGIGLGGAMRFRLNKSFTINPVTGEEEGNRTVTAYYSMEYDASKADNAAGHSGWMLVNHNSFTADVFYLDNVVTDLTTDILSLSGELALAGGFDHLGGQHGAIVGDFNFQTTVVPVPAAIWLFASAFTGLFAARLVANRSVA